MRRLLRRAFGRSGSSSLEDRMQRVSDTRLAVRPAAELTYSNDYDKSTYHRSVESRRTRSIAVEELPEYDPEILVLPELRQSVIDDLNTDLRRRWANGGVLLDIYRIGISHNSAISEADPCGLIRGLGYSRLLPAELQGCSWRYLCMNGVWREDLGQLIGAVGHAFGDAPYDRGDLSEQEVMARSHQYVAALIGDHDPNHVHCFGLDLGFSSWFLEVAWDFAFCIIHSQEHWGALLVATDTD